MNNNMNISDEIVVLKQEFEALECLGAELDASINDLPLKSVNVSEVIDAESVSAVEFDKCLSQKLIKEREELCFKLEQLTPEERIELYNKINEEALSIAEDLGVEVVDAEYDEGELDD